jgi:hypothetical protein
MLELYAEMHVDLRMKCLLFLSDFLPKLELVNKFYENSFFMHTEK